MAATYSVQQQHVPLKMPKKRVTMIKHVVGKVKTTSYTLPEDPKFVYGIPNKMNEYGAGDILQNWLEADASKPQESMLSFPLTNRKAVQNGYLSAKSQREFAKKNPVMKAHPNPKFCAKKQQDKGSNPINNNCGNAACGSSSSMESSQDDVAGIKTVKNDVPIKDLLSSASEDFKEADYPDLSNLQKKGRLPPAKSTKASRLLEASLNAPVKGKPEFKMSKFLKVESKVKKMM